MDKIHVVYISKSNRANPNLLIQLRQELSDKGIEIIEWEGQGNYNDFFQGVLKKIDALFVISHPDYIEPGTGGINLGSGIFGECYKAHTKNIPVIHFTNEQDIIPFSSVTIYGEDELKKKNSWQLRYGYGTHEVEPPKKEEEFYEDISI